jgi:uncharacterized damage-inducible protein DinB
MLVDQLRFARSELLRCLEGLSEEDALRRLGQMNSIGWIVGHLADQEHRYWVQLAQGKDVAPDLNALVGYGRPATTPPLAEMKAVWREVTGAANGYLDQLTAEALAEHLLWQGQPTHETVGTRLLRNIYHYWFHIGEAHAIRQGLGHLDLPDFVGSMEDAAYRPES